MNLLEAAIILHQFHALHPETKNMSPEQVNQFVLTLPDDERDRIEQAGQCIAVEAREAVEILMGRK